MTSYNINRKYVIVLRIEWLVWMSPLSPATEVCIPTLKLVCLPWPAVV